jgi:hypothetical protein
VRGEERYVGALGRVVVSPGIRSWEGWILMTCMELE